MARKHTYNAKQFKDDKPANHSICGLYNSNLLK